MKRTFLIIGIVLSVAMTIAITVRLARFASYCAVIIVSSPLDGMYPGHPKNYDYSSVVELFQEHQDEMKKISEIMIRSSDAFRSRPQGRTIMFYSEGADQYFSPDDWAIIQQFFEDTKPFSVEVYSRSEKVEFVFLSVDRTPSEDPDPFVFFYNLFEEDVYGMQGYEHVEELARNWYLCYGWPY